MSEVAHLDGTMDLVTMNMVIHHLDTDKTNYPNGHKAIKNLARLLKPGAKICINTLLKENFDALW